LSGLCLGNTTLGSTQGLEFLGSMQTLDILKKGGGIWSPQEIICAGPVDLSIANRLCKCPDYACPALHDLIYIYIYSIPDELNL